jgi:hypothetical protein
LLCLEKKQNVALLVQITLLRQPVKNEQRHGTTDKFFDSHAILTAGSYDSCKKNDFKMATYVAVVGVVIKQMVSGGSQILLLKRNAQRRTSPNKWQTPSGFIRGVCRGGCSQRSQGRNLARGYNQEEWKSSLQVLSKTTKQKSCFLRMLT